MYQDKLACAIKVGGRVLREQGANVFLPFGSEYSFLIKNLNNRRAKVSITIDGQDVVDGGLIVNANSSVELERFVKADQLSVGNRFKFIERNSKVEQARGIGVEDGLIRVEFEFEHQVTYQPQTTYWHPFNTVYGGQDAGKRYADTKLGDFIGSVGAAGAIGTNEVFSSVSVNAYSSEASFSADAEPRSLRSKKLDTPKNDAGITVPGSVSTQTFTTTFFTGCGQTSVMVFKLLGETPTAPVVAPVTVKSKQKCVTCNHVNKATSKFCSECGTSLEVF